MDGLETRAVWPVELEYRQAGRTLSGSFPYGSTATISNAGRVRKERFEPGAFNYALQDKSREINLLSGHSYDQPVASRSAGTLKLEDSKDALRFTAELPVEGDQPSWIVDLVRSVRGGLMRGLSPGFTVPPKTAVSNAEVLVAEAGNPGVQIRRIYQAVLYELSIVTRAAYKEAAVDLRADGLAAPEPDMERYYRWL